MRKRHRARAGDFVAVPLPSGGYGYGRVLNKLMAFYDLKTNEVTDINEVSKHGVIFKTAVHVSAFSGGSWPVIGSRPLELEFLEPTKFFRKDPAGAEFLIYVSKPTPPHSYEEYCATAEECIGLEPLLVWEPNQISQRLEDYFLGQRNEHSSFYLNQVLDRGERRFVN
jgi:Immunity protein 26